MLENPMLGGILLGLRYDEDYLAAKDPEFFNCCHGSGTWFDDATQTSVRCELTARMSRISELLSSCETHWGEEFLRKLFSVPTAQSLKILEQVSSVLKGYAPQGSLFQGGGGDSLFYKMAVAATWRFGVRCQVINFKKRNAKFGALPVSDDCEALFVEQIGGLWDPNVAAALDHLVSIAYHRNLCLWLEFVPGEGLAKSGKADAKAASPFTRKISAIKGKDPLSFLRAETFSRLRDLTNLHRPIQ
jgi:hypothetical protein